MTTERKTGQAEDVTDANVSAAYRELAGERTPASLNERVLREARANAGSGYSYWMGWLRPAAWVATVGLCLAIVVELTNTPLTDVGRSDIPASAAPAVPAEAAPEARRESGLVEDREPVLEDTSMSSDALRRQQAVRKHEADSPAAEAQDVVAPQAVPEADERIDALGRSSEPAEAKARANSDLFTITDAPILEEAEEMARMREGSVQEPAAGAARASFAASVAADDADRPASCDDETRSTPESWIECIVDIEQRGGDAAEERSAFEDAFPGVELP